MAVVISPGILAAICILSVELVVIIIVIAFLLWRGKQGNKTHGIPQINGDKFETKTSTKDYKADVSNNQLEVTQEDKYMGNSLQKSNSIKSLNVSETKEPISESSGISCEDHILANGVFYETNEEEDVAKEDDIAAAHPPSVTYMAKEEENSEVLITSNDNTQVNFTDGNMLMETAVSNTEECPGPCTPRNTTQLVSLLPPPNSSVAEHSTPEFSKLSLKPTKK
uniref:Uncharacterized protein n=1 Tax=Ciona savignyi TaxID=51511 RepID=H2YPY6_CIOSA